MKDNKDNYVAIQNCPKCRGAVFSDCLATRKWKTNIEKCFHCGGIYIRENGKLVAVSRKGER